MSQDPSLCGRRNTCLLRSPWNNIRLSAVRPAIVFRKHVVRRGGHGTSVPGPSFGGGLSITKWLSEMEFRFGSGDQGCSTK